MSTITIPRAVVEQALEALELTSEKRDPMRVSAIIALKAALAEPPGSIPQPERAKRMAAQWRGCQVCGIGADGKTYGYVCPRGDCPTQVTCGSAV